MRNTRVLTSTIVGRQIMTMGKETIPKSKNPDEVVRNADAFPAIIDKEAFERLRPAWTQEKVEMLPIRQKNRIISLVISGAVNAVTI